MNKKSFNSKFLSLVMAGACMSLTAAAQSITVKGHVQDTQGEPVVFATVTVPGTKTTTQTDADGNFRINVAADDPELGAPLPYLLSKLLWYRPVDPQTPARCQW